MAGVLDESKFLVLILYHRACYQSYISKESMAYKQSTQDQGETSGSHSYTTRSSLTKQNVFFVTMQKKMVIVLSFKFVLFPCKNK